MMKKITVHFQSNIKGVYTTEIETCEEDWFLAKHNRMVHRWFDIICPYTDMNKYTAQLSSLNLYSKKDHLENCKTLIENHIKHLNELNKELIDSGKENQRTFTITVEDCQE